MLSGCSIVLANPRLLGPEAKPLDDFLFHQYMRFAAELHLPVQIHTGHLAGSYNRVNRANVAHFIPVMELHRDVQFDLFHGNYPYMGDILFAVKNYPNAALNFCWLYIIDPMYSKDLLQRAILTIPHTKLHGFGGDYRDIPEYSMAHLKLAREVIAAALAPLVQAGWCSESDAMTIARGMLFDNPNRFFDLSLT
jgi:predicted TIM-barrel fold metal-dependent hydrolase